MPIFDYRCKECSNLYDILHKGKEVIEDIQCPLCGSTHYTKLISLPGIIAKSTGRPPCDSQRCGMDQSCCGGSCGLN
ncbi:MAG: zinc ribbon domain-containing protein [Ignavibacteriae bacterium]|nr:MAG: zinc ribbon domain-containing protein [Ignavibacteriota bacterium]